MINIIILIKLKFKVKDIFLDSNQEIIKLLKYNKLILIKLKHILIIKLLKKNISLIVIIIIKYKKMGMLFKMILINLNNR